MTPFAADHVGPSDPFALDCLFCHFLTCTCVLMLNGLRDVRVGDNVGFWRTQIRVVDSSTTVGKKKTHENHPTYREPEYETRAMNLR